MKVETKRIETMLKWIILKQAIKDKGYGLWYTQYDWFEPEGDNIAFQKDGIKGLIVITHDQEVAEDMKEFR